MKINGEQLCRCGHKAMAHTYGVFNSSLEEADLETVQNNPCTDGCCYCRKNENQCKIFQLPNLDLIEYLAKERGLV